MHTGGDENILLIGLPGFRAKRLLAHLIASRPSARVFALLEPQHEAGLRDVVRQLDSGAAERVELLVGSPTSMDLGLSGAEYLALAGRVHRVHHVAHVTHPGTRRAEAERVNIGATRELIEFGRVCKTLDAIVFHSTASVSGTRTGVVYEDELAAGQAFHSVIDETLARAERLVRGAMGEMPVVIVRPAQVIGDSMTGEMDRHDGLYGLVALLSSGQDFPLALSGQDAVPMNVVPVDYATAAAAHIGGRPQSVGRTFHIIDPKPLSVSRVFQLMASRAGVRRAQGGIPASVLKTVLRVPGAQWVTPSPKAFVGAITTPVTYDCRNAEQLLEGSGLTCPPLESYLDKIVDYVRRSVTEEKLAAEEQQVEDPFA